MPQWLALVLTGLITAGLPSLLSARNSNRVKRLEKANEDAAEAKTKADAADDARAAQWVLTQKINTDAFERAQRINNEIVDGLREEITRLRTELDAVRTQATTAELRNLDAERRYAAMERSVGRMESLVRQYERQLREAGIEVREGDAE